MNELIGLRVGTEIKMSVITSNHKISKNVRFTRYMEGLLKQKQMEMAHFTFFDAYFYFAIRNFLLLHFALSVYCVPTYATEED